jgi:hypothetical protein
MEPPATKELPSPSFVPLELSALSATFAQAKLQGGMAQISPTASPQMLQNWLLRLQMSLAKTSSLKPTPLKPSPPSKPHKDRSTTFVLIRPKVVTLPPPPPKPKKVKKKADFFYDSPFRIKRSRSAMLPPAQYLYA